MQTIVDLNLLRHAPVVLAPFPHLIVCGFVPPAAAALLARDFPRQTYPGGSFPLQSLRYGPSFRQLAHSLASSAMAEIVGEKFGIRLLNLPTMITVRGWSRRRDGKIHTDSTSKVVTGLLYMNDSWESGSGRLRLLRSSADISDYALEVPPDYGTLLLFKNGPTAWHGFECFEGRRRVVQVNWVSNRLVAAWEQTRHRLSAAAKRIANRAGEEADAAY